MNKKEPLVMCLTNTVAANFTANVLLAIGAKPAMVEEPSEAAQLAAVADAVLVNLGTVHPRQAEAMEAAVRACAVGSVPWVLDPVAAHLLDYRRSLMAKLLAIGKPALIRGNHAEIDNLLGAVPMEIPILSTGETDRIRVNGEVTEVSGGVQMLQQVTATGCAQGAVCAAYLGWGQSPKEACSSASKLMKRAGEVAWERAKTPGSFKIALIDALWELTHK